MIEVAQQLDQVQPSSAHRGAGSAGYLAPASAKHWRGGLLKVRKGTVADGQADHYIF